MSFKPDDLRAVTKTKLDDLIAALDSRFKDAVSRGYFIHEHQDRITLIFGQSFSSDGQLYNDLIALREDVEKHYLSAGWPKVEIKTSEENGERPGLISITLFKGEKTEPVDHAALIRRELSDIRACLAQMPIQRSAEKQFNIIGISLSNLSKIADQMQKP